jgi:hypothetical protein
MRWRTRKPIGKIISKSGLTARCGMGSAEKGWSKVKDQGVADDGEMTYRSREPPHIRWTAA